MQSQKIMDQRGIPCRSGQKKKVPERPIRRGKEEPERGGDIEGRVRQNPLWK